MLQVPSDHAGGAATPREGQADLTSQSRPDFCLQDLEGFRKVSPSSSLKRSAPMRPGRGTASTDLPYADAFVVHVRRTCHSHLAWLGVLFPPVCLLQVLRSCCCRTVRDAGGGGGSKSEWMITSYLLARVMERPLEKRGTHIPVTGWRTLESEWGYSSCCITGLRALITICAPKEASGPRWYRA